MLTMRIIASVYRRRAITGIGITSHSRRKNKERSEIRKGDRKDEKPWASDYRQSIVKDLVEN